MDPKADRTPRPRQYSREAIPELAHLPSEARIGLKWGLRGLGAIVAGGLAPFVAQVLAHSFGDLLGPLLVPGQTQTFKDGVFALLIAPAILVFLAIGLYGAASAYRYAAEHEPRDELSEQSAVTTALTVGAWLILRFLIAIPLFLPAILARSIVPLALLLAGFGATLHARIGLSALTGWLENESLVAAFSPLRIRLALPSSSLLWAAAFGEGALIAGVLAVSDLAGDSGLSASTCAVLIVLAATGGRVVGARLAGLRSRRDLVENL